MLEAALQAPERVAKLVLVSPNPFGWSEEVQAIAAQEEELFDAGDFDAAAELMVRAWLVSPRREAEEVDASLRTLVHSAQRRAYELDQGEEACLNGARSSRRGSRARLSSCAAPWTSKTSRAPAPRLVDELPDAREVVFDDCAHLPTLEQPERFARVVLEFLDATA